MDLKRLSPAKTSQHCNHRKKRQKERPLQVQTTEPLDQQHQSQHDKGSAHFALAQPARTRQLQDHCIHEFPHQSGLWSTTATTHTDILYSLPIRKAVSRAQEEKKPVKSIHKNDSLNTIEYHQTNSPLEMLHIDICGPLSTRSLADSRYIFTITNDYSRFTWLFFLKHKSETLSKFRQFKATVELQENCRIKIIRSDRGGEYISN